jgi:hypothetical protein
VLAQPSNLNQAPADVPERDDPVDRSIAIGVGCTILFHILLVLLSPQFAFQKFSGIHSGISVNHSKTGKTFEFELAQPAVKEKERAPFKFVQTNSEAPENMPDKTDNFSNRNQQSAQQVAALEKDPENRPSVKGQDKIKSDDIVSGDLSPPQAPSAPSTDVAKDEAKDQAEQKARLEQVMDEGSAKFEGKSEDGIAMNKSTSKSVSTHANQTLEGAPDGKSPEGGLVTVQQSIHAQPKERPRLASTSLNRSTVLATRIAGTSNVGIVGRDARWSEYGEYLNEVLEIVQRQWWRILEESRVSPPRGSHVVVTFRINAKGETDIVKVEDSDAGKQGVFSCQNAITYPQPYRKWSDQMIAVLGDAQEITIAFYYQ